MVERVEKELRVKLGQLDKRAQKDQQDQKASILHDL